MSLQLELPRDRFAPGEWVTGAVVVSERVDARSLAVHLMLVEVTRDYGPKAVRSLSSGSLHEGPLPAGSSFPFQVQLEADAPPPYRCQWGQLYWVVDAKADVPGNFDLHATQYLLVLPPGVEASSLVHPGATEFPGVVPGPVAALGATGGGAPAAESAPTAASAPGSFPAEWYPDPWLVKRLRWWDGNAWTGHTAD
jgi:hypothetical protein